MFRTLFSRDVEPLSEPDLARLRSTFAGLRKLAPGDFAAVARRRRAMGGAASARELLAAVVAELRGKPGASAAVGF